jgi:hypothetical protein
MFLLWTGCSSVQNRRESYIEEYPDLSPAVSQAVRDGMIVIGMTEDDVAASWGEPAGVSLTLDRETRIELWRYEAYPGWEHNAGPADITFTNGLVTSWTR